MVIVIVIVVIVIIRPNTLSRFFFGQLVNPWHQVARFRIVEFAGFYCDPRFTRHPFLRIQSCVLGLLREQYRPTNISSPGKSARCSVYGQKANLLVRISGA